MTIDDIDRTASVVVRVERAIEAPLDVLWSLHTGVGAWPSWQQDISKAQISGPFEAGTQFVWHTAGFDDEIRSTIAIVEPQSRTLWGGPAMGIDGRHLWRFEARDGAVLVVTEESFSGAPVADAAEKLKAGLTTSLERWLGFLERAAKTR